MIRYCAQHPNAANLIMLAIIMLGLSALPQFKRETFPALNHDKVDIQIRYRGATPQEVSDNICQRLETAIDTVVNLEELRCQALEGIAKATAVMVENSDYRTFHLDIKAAVESIDDFPEQVETAQIIETAKTEPVISIALTGLADTQKLKDYAENLQQKLKKLANVSQVIIRGFSDRHLRVEIDASTLRKYDLSMQEIADKIQERNIALPIGKLEQGREDILLRFDDQNKNPLQLQNLIVLTGKDGALIRLGEIAKIYNTFDRPENQILVNGKKAALLDIHKNRNQDMLTAVEEIKQFIATERQRAPSSIKITLTRDFASNVKDRLSMIVKNGVQGLILVFFVLLIFFNARFSFWVTMGLPVSFLGALFVLYHIGVSINMISMVGLLIGIGLLMDDAIVISENVAARLTKGVSPMHAAIEGTREVLPGILSSFATTLLIFGALAFIQGEMGQILRVMPVVLIVVLSVSLIEAFFILPNHLSHAMERPTTPRSKKIRQKIDQGFYHFREHYFGPLLDRAIRYRYLTAGLMLMLVILSIAMLRGGILKFRAFPDLEGDIIEARLLLPQGTPLHRTEAVVKQILDGLHKLNGEYKIDQPLHAPELIKNVVVLYNENPDAYENGPHVVQISADLLEERFRTQPLDHILKRWQTIVGVIPDVVFIKYTEPAVGLAGRPIDIRLYGEDFSQLKQASIQLQNQLRALTSVYDLHDDLRPGKKEYRFQFKPEAEMLGVNPQRVANQIRSAFHGVELDTFQKGSETFKLYLRLSEQDRLYPEQLDHFFIQAKKQAQIPIQAVVRITEQRNWARIYRVNGQNVVTIQGDINTKSGNTQEIMTLVEQQIMPKLMIDYPSLSYSIEGEQKNSGKTRGSIRQNILFGIIGVFILLAFQFRGYLFAFLVMSIIPTALIGVVWGHLSLGLDLSMPSIVGMISLIGIVVNDSILLVQFMAQAKAAGMDTETAAQQAGRQRFRSILLTSLTTLGGLLPLLLEKSLQAQVLIPLATSIAYGLAGATVIALFLVPSLYCIADDFHLLKKSA
ncbi:efflux RND transporter permease subunit [Magnetococcales bacterium HHB-1]